MSRFIFTFFCICSFFLNLNAFPVAFRQDAQPQPTTVQTTKTANTPAGQMITTCEITLTPIKDSNGQDAVEEVTKCKVAMDGVNNGAASPSSSSASQGGQAPPTDAPATTTDAAPSDIAPTQSVVTATVTTDTAAPASSSPGSDTAAQPTDVAASSPASSPAPPTTTPSPPATTPSPPATTAAPASTTAAGAIRPNGVSTVAVADLSSLLTATTTGTAAQQNESATATPSASAAAAFELPGSKLSVLPIGLGVFAGISVIALIVVGLVTYERTKYRKAFRQRKLAEQGSSMGYGGNMAEVRA